MPPPPNAAAIANDRAHIAHQERQLIFESCEMLDLHDLVQMYRLRAGHGCLHLYLALTV